MYTTWGQNTRSLTLFFGLFCVQFHNEYYGVARDAWNAQHMFSTFASLVSYTDTEWRRLNVTAGFLVRNTRRMVNTISLISGLGIFTDQYGYGTVPSINLLVVLLTSPETNHWRKLHMVFNLPKNWNEWKRTVKVLVIGVGLRIQMDVSWNFCCTTAKWYISGTVSLIPVAR